MLLKGALHTHTTCSDGALSLAEVVDAYVELGFDFVAITDHDYFTPARCLEKQLSQVRRAGEMIIFSGVELTVFEKGYVHVARVDGDEEVLHIFNHPAQLNLPLEKVVQRIESVTAVVPIDAVEVTANGFYTPEYDVAAIPLPKVATDDSHDRKGCGRAWIELDGRRDKDAILRHIKHGDFWNCYNTR